MGIKLMVTPCDIPRYSGRVKLLDKEEIVTNLHHCSYISLLYLQHILSSVFGNMTIHMLISVDRKVSDSYDTAKVTCNLTGYEKCSRKTIVN